jgi:oxygen-independent coproporphyrinogen-3 oxidase
MKGLYIHIPFCRKACNYCDFHFTVSVRYQHELCDAICRELQFRKAESGGMPLRSIYLGGGTPSMIPEVLTEKIFAAIYNCYQVDASAEITLEANPDDLSIEKLQYLKTLGINRLSIGVQSFRDEDLRFMNRSHNAETAEKSIELAYGAGFKSLSIDLIYGVPGLTNDAWKSNLKKAAELGINHLSCYSLTLENSTPYAKLVSKRQLPAPDDQQAAEQMALLMDLSQELGFEQYEISNFARNGAYAIHNSAYWQGITYIGIGPSAHSFDGSCRRHNEPNNNLYIRSLQSGDAAHSIENPDEKSLYNEWVLTGLRTKWGVQPEKLDLAGKGLADYFVKCIQPWVTSGHAINLQGAWILTKKGRLLADRIAMDCFIA